MADKKIKQEFKEYGEEVKKKVKGLGPVKTTVLIVLTIGTVCSFIFFDYIHGSKNVFVAHEEWSDFLNALWVLIPKLITSVQIITIFLIITTLLLKIISHLLCKTQRGITVAQLVNNLLKWIVAIVLVIVVLAVWGVDTTALITGAGVITLVVGLGLQSLISDVVAGLFIVFENEFNVGDIVTIDGFRGEVISIGIRTTKLKTEGNVKIFNNSQISGILNQALEPSVAKAYISIEYGAALKDVEKIIREQLPQIDISGVYGEISYDGVSALGDSAVTLQFSAKCDESNFYSVQRSLNAAVKNMFDENGIDIPFNQLVVHMAEK